MPTKKKSDYASKLTSIRKYDNVSFRTTKHFTPAQKGTITKKWKKIAPFVSKKSESGDYKYVFVKGAKGITSNKKVTTSKGVFVQLPRRVKGEVTVTKKGNNAIIDYKNGKTGRASRRDILITVDAKRLVKNPESYLRGLYKSASIRESDILAVHFLFGGFQNKYRYTAGYFVKYIETDDGFKSLKRKRSLNSIITGIKVVTINRKRKRK